MNSQLGDYRLIRELGRGTLGQVFLAEHQFLKHPYALKVLSDELASEAGFIERFEKEVVQLATLDHPHIVKVHNVSCSDGHYFLVTESIADSTGETLNLAQYLSSREKRLSEEEAVKILTEVAAALNYAHEKGIPHRGLKLNNILVKKGKEGISIFLSDFGLTRIFGNNAVLNRTIKALAELLETTTPTKLHLSFFQSYACLAPEQKIGGKKKSQDLKADIYAFGVLAYYLAVREFPEGAFPMPSTRVPDYSHQWDLLVARCLQPDPNKRPETLKKALEEFFSAPRTEPKPLLKPQEIVKPDADYDPSAIFQTELTVGPYQPAPREENTAQPLLTDMVVIAGGTYERGSNQGARDEMPRHAVHLSPFALDVYPVTNEQFSRFLEAMGGEKDAHNNDIIRLRESRIKRSGGKLQIESGYAKHPVVGVTWYGAIAYAKWVGKRLPTEAEWEIAAYGGLEGAIYPTGGDMERSQANFFSSDTTPVMSYPPNEYGLFDMAGNVYEWCQDWYEYHYYDISVQEPNQPRGPVQGVYRVLRGGCWKSLKEDLRCAHRHRNNPGTMNGTYGFRCAADVK